MNAMAWGNNTNQQSSSDTHVVIDGRTGRVLDDDHRDRDTDRGQQDRGSARFIYDDHGRPTPYHEGQEW